MNSMAILDQLKATFVFRLTFLLLLLLGVILTAPASALTILAGYDMFEVEDGTAYIDFSLDPLPADFFDPGSDPFFGLVPLRGEPLGSHPVCPDDNLSDTDALLRRLTDVELPDPTSTDVVDVEIIALELRSVSPFPVTFGGGKRVQNYDLEVSVPPWTFGTVVFRRLVDHEADATRVVVQYKIKVSSPDDPPGYQREYLDRWLPAEMLPSWKWVETTPAGGKSPAATCTSNVCVNPGFAGVFSTGPLAFSLIGTCVGDPVDVEEATWGGLKARYR